MNYTNGDVYNGFWCDGKRSGKGIYRTNSNYEYKGTFFNNKKHGYGLLTFPDGSFYNGEWV